VNRGELVQPFQLPFDAALQAFLAGQDAAGHSKISAVDYKRVVGQFLRYMAREHQYTYVQQIQEQDVLEWLAYLRNTTSRLGRPYSSRSIRTYCVDVFAFFNWLYRHEYIDENPVELVDAPKIEKPLIRVFTEEEIERLDAACDREAHGRSLTPDERKALAARDRAILWLLLSTGIRLSELCGLRFCDIDWDKGMIYVFGKGAKERVVPFGKVARQYLNTYLQYWRGKPTDPVNDHVFIGVFGRPITYYSVKKIFERLKVKAGIQDKRVSAHTCRHWFAVNAIKNGMPSTVLQNLLGHERLEMINTYVRLAEQDKRELYNRYSPADSLKMHRSKDRRSEIREWRNARKRKDERRL
jgi:site-specific recombinase XerD